MAWGIAGCRLRCAWGKLSRKVLGDPSAGLLVGPGGLFGEPNRRHWCGVSVGCWLGLGLRRCHEWLAGTAQVRAVPRPLALLPVAEMKNSRPSDGLGREQNGLPVSAG